MKTVKLTVSETIVQVMNVAVPDDYELSDDMAAEIWGNHTSSAYTVHGDVDVEMEATEEEPDITLTLCYVAICRTEGNV